MSFCARRLRSEGVMSRFAPAESRLRFAIVVLHKTQRESGRLDNRVTRESPESLQIDASQVNVEFEVVPKVVLVHLFLCNFGNAVIARRTSSLTSQTSAVIPLPSLVIGAPARLAASRVQVPMRTDARPRAHCPTTDTIRSGHCHQS